MKTIYLLLYFSFVPLWLLQQFLVCECKGTFFFIYNTTFLPIVCAHNSVLLTFVNELIRVKQPKTKKNPYLFFAITFILLTFA